MSSVDKDYNSLDIWFQSRGVRYVYKKRGVYFSCRGAVVSYVDAYLVLRVWVVANAVAMVFAHTND